MTWRNSCLLLFNHLPVFFGLYAFLLHDGRLYTNQCARRRCFDQHGQQAERTAYFGGLTGNLVQYLLQLSGIALGIVAVEYHFSFDADTAIENFRPDEFLKP